MFLVDLQLMWIDLMGYNGIHSENMKINHDTLDRLSQ